MKPDVRWFVASGPNASHLHDSNVFARLYQAREFAEALPPTPTGEPRPYRITRAEFCPRSGLLVRETVLEAVNLFERDSGGAA